MAVICGAIGVGARSGAVPALNGVLATLEPHGERGEVVELGAPGLSGTVAARWRTGSVAPVAQACEGSEPPLVSVVGDVRLDRSRQLAHELGMRSSATGAEMVLAAYLRWGNHCPLHLFGEFAFAVADVTRPGVLLARDHAGHRPLAVHERAGQVAFASTALALTAYDGVGHELDLQRAVEVLALAPTERTFVAGVRMLPPGSALWLGPDGVRRWRWWAPERIPIRDLKSLDAHAQEMRERLEDSVAGMVAGVDRVGVRLSGGLDSTSVAATVARLRAPGRVDTYTSVPPRDWRAVGDLGRDPDETHLVAALARRYANLAPQYVDVAGRDLFGGHEPLWELGAPPVRNASNAMWMYAINEAARADGVDVLLTGGMGNFAFSADGPRVLVDLLRRGRVIRAATEVRARAVRAGSSARAVTRSELVALGMPTWLWRGSLRRGHLDRVAEWLGATALHPERAEALDLVALMPLLASPDATRWTRSGSAAFAGNATQSEQRLATSAWWGLDVRDPTAERGLLEAALAQPEWWRRHNGVDRAIVRRAMVHWLPTEIVDRTARGAQLPDWFDRLVDVRTTIESELESARDHLPSREVIDIDRLTTLVRSWPDRADSFTRQATRDYRLALPRALLVSRYLRWFESRARRVAAGGPAIVLPAR